MIRIIETYDGSLYMEDNETPDRTIFNKIFVAVRPVRVETSYKPTSNEIYAEKVTEWKPIHNYDGVDIEYIDAKSIKKYFDIEEKEEETE